MKSQSNPFKSVLKVMPLAVVALGLVFFGGCSSDNTFAPTQSVDFAGGPPMLHGPSTNPELSALGEETWYQVAGGWAKPGEVSYIQGGRYRLKAYSESVSEDTYITISEWDPNVLEAQFTPHGTEFGRSVKLTVNYAGTNADPWSVNYDGSSPVFYWWNPDTEAWEQMPGWNNGWTREYTVFLQHFSIYRLGTGEW